MNPIFFSLLEYHFLEKHHECLRRENDYSVFFCFILIELNNQDLTIKESFLTGPKLKVTVTSNFLIPPNSN